MSAGVWKQLSDFVSGRTLTDMSARLLAVEGRLDEVLARAANAEQRLHEAEGRRAADAAAAVTRARALAELTADAVMLEDSLRRLASPREARGLCVVSVLPPAATGIAYCTLSTYARAPFPVDIFAPQESLADYLTSVDNLQLVGTLSEAFAIKSLSRGRARRSYAGEVFTFGNSPHHLETYAALRRREARGPVLAHLHEPFLIDLAKAHAKATERPLVDLMREAYGARLDGLTEALSGDDFVALAEAGVLGARALFHDLDLSGFVVNSQAARDLLLRDYPELDPVRVHVLFHPVFPPAPVKLETRETLRIGSFGVPGWLKHTPLLIEAFRLLRARTTRPVELWLAGFDVDYYTREHGYSGEPGLVLVDAPHDRAFEALMANVDLAVQLRSRTLGESSGVVAQLLARGTPVLASRIGSFQEFGDAIAPAPNPLDATALAQAIEHELAEGAGARAAAVRDYVENRRPERFCTELKALIENAMS